MLCHRVIINKIYIHSIVFRIDEPQVILSGSDSDDDVQFIEATYEPLCVAKKPTKQTETSQQPQQLLQQLQQSPQLQPAVLTSPVPCQVVPHSPLLPR